MKQVYISIDICSITVHILDSFGGTISTKHRDQICLWYSSRHSQKLAVHSNEGDNFPQRDCCIHISLGQACLTGNKTRQLSAVLFPKSQMVLYHKILLTSIQIFTSHYSHIRLINKGPYKRHIQHTISQREY